MNNLLKALNSKTKILGPFAKTSDPQFIEILGYSGFDFVILDVEHGPNSVRDLIPLINTCRAAGISPVVRVGEISAIGIQRILDLGVDGIQIPQVCSVRDLDNIQRFTRFSPEGERGACRFVKAARYSLLEQEKYYLSENRIPRIVHLEGKAGFDILDDFVTHQAVDVLFIGPYDLSHSLGMPGKIRSTEVRKVILEIIEKCNSNNKAVGIFADTLEDARMYAEMGVRYLSYSVDTGIFAEGCRMIVGELRPDPK